MGGRSEDRVNRGGCWDYIDSDARSSFRGRDGAGFRFSDLLGFRIRRRLR